MNYLKPTDKNSFLIICEKCKAIINFTRKDLYCMKEADMQAFAKGDLRNTTRVYLKCPCCAAPQDVIAGFRYVSNDDKWF